MTARAHYDPTKVAEIRKGMPFVMHSRELLASDAWTSLGINARRLINLLEIEHMNHAGRQNGYLIATYKQLERLGMNRKYISHAIQELEKKGLIIVEHRGRSKQNESYANLFTLTYLKACVKDDDNSRRYYSPSNEWKRYKETKKRR